MSETSKFSAGRAILLGIWGLFCLLPIIFFATIALRPRNEIIAPSPIYFPTISIETWAKIWAEWPIMTYFWNSVVAVTGSVIICLVLGIPAAYSLARYRYRFRGLIGRLILFAYLLGLGYPADRPLRPIRKPNRRPFDEVVHRGRW